MEYPNRPFFVPNTLNRIQPQLPLSEQALATALNNDKREEDLNRRHTLSTCVWVVGKTAQGTTRYLDQCSSFTLTLDLERKSNQEQIHTCFLTSGSASVSSSTWQYKAEMEPQAQKRPSSFSPFLFIGHERMTPGHLKKTKGFLNLSSHRIPDFYYQINDVFKNYLVRYTECIMKLGGETPKQLHNLPTLNLKATKENLDNNIQSFLKEGNLREARQLLKVAVALFSENKYRRLLKIIAPPEIVSIKKAETKGIEETIAFLRERGSEFRNKWLVLSGGQLLDISQSYGKLFRKYKGQNVIITRIV
jgi:hypothetical protein